VISGLDANSQVIQNPPDSLIDGETVHVIQVGDHEVQSPESGSPPQ
jgi:hypothetical protein